jgi:hypothetical protein
LGGLFFAGAALLSAAAVGLEWRLAPPILRNPLVLIVLVAAGVLVLFTALFRWALDRAQDEPIPRASAGPTKPSTESSLMALPAMVSEESPRNGTVPTPEAASEVPLPPTTSPVMPAGLAASGPASSTLLIPFAGNPASTAGSSSGPSPGQTVTRLVDRMDAIQRTAPSNPSPKSPSQNGPTPSELLLRLTRIPNPPTAASATTGARRCNDCGEPLGSPPHFEPCGDCGRALCERCYWRTSSGAAAHLCRSCVRDRSVPRPPTPAVTFGRPVPAASASTPSSRPLRPRPPVR